jgi:septal ring factor EnvC (AmiA/AmiB activator)
MAGNAEANMQLDHIRSEIERMRTQVRRQRSEIRQLQRAGIQTTSAEALLKRMFNKIDELCAERDKLKRDGPRQPRAKFSVVADGERASPIFPRPGRSSALD